MTDPGYTVFARRYRPATFDEVVGQETVATTLRNAIGENRVGHAYVFCGPRGVGKTSMARILARALNCGRGPTADPCGECEMCRRIHEGSDADVIELDAASNRGVDDARALREGVRYAPLRSRFKIYIIDEAHMLTREAFNTLLKTLEEPPPHVKFVFATTEIRKLPDTITSRCQRFDFRRITARDITARLEQIAREEKIDLTAEVLGAVARAGRGSMRDAQSLLDQLVAFKTSGAGSDDVAAILGAAAQGEVVALVDGVAAGDPRPVLEVLDRVFGAGVDGTAFQDQLLDHFRSLLLIRACGKEAPPVDLPDTELETAAGQSEKFSVEALLYLIQLLLEARRRIREGADVRLVLEVTAVKMARSADLIPLSEALQRLDSPAPVAPAPAARPAPPPEAPHPEYPPEPEAAESEPVVSGESDPWHDVVETVRGQNVLAGTLLAEGRLRRVGAQEVEFLLPPKFTQFHVRALGEQKHREVIEQALQKAYGKRLGFTVSLEHGGPAPEPERPAAAPKPRSDIANDAGVRKILETFPESRIVGIE